MPARFIAILLLALAAVSCDKVKSLTAKASSSMQEKSATQGGSASTKADPELQKLVDQTAAGVIFRKDLPFPAHRVVRTTHRQEMSGRLVESSAIENRSAEVKGTRLTITKLERTGDQVRYTPEKSSFSLPVADTPDTPNTWDKFRRWLKGAEPVEQLDPKVPPVTFRKTGNAWKPEDRNDFRSAFLAKQLTPVFDRLLVANALAPRTLWFAKRRFKPGDQLVVSGETLPMLLEGATKGTFTLKLEAFEAVEGHPCGVFAVTGDYSRKNVPDFDGNTSDEDVTIQGGKIWFSLIYPVILKRQLDTIQSAKSGSQGGQISRGQGAIKISETRAWKRLPP
jgi:hypothetical protein